ncbi:transcriptional regulator [Pseudomonas sp. Sample_9]|uniref:transcriptional regulator n=1 Tax=Pseudomonas sp. Sample_9 TaxID=2382158 RepID=UPI001032D220|nr:transcriptional regulator [Pseudomonas sp. Sample_9]
MIEKFTRWNSADFLLTDADLKDYLEACMDEARGDDRFIVKARETIERARLRTNYPEKGLVRL